jgi:hypothetical protein
MALIEHISQEALPKEKFLDNIPKEVFLMEFSEDFPRKTIVSVMM